MNIVNVQKRDGSLEPFEANKVHKVINWAVDNVNGVSLSEIEINAHLESKPVITAKEIHAALIDSAVNLISLKTPNYQIVASRLLNYQLRKDLWGGKIPPVFYDFVKNNIEVNEVYDKDVLSFYTKEEFEELEFYIDHDRDFNFQYSGMRQLCDKYLIKNRNTGEIYETPQFAYMLIAMISFHNYDKDIRLDYVKRAYDDFSKFKINLPTPLMAGVRSRIKQYSSCCLIDVDDSMNSIMSSSSAVGFATAQRYGIGLNMGRIRAMNSPIRNGEVVHTGAIPFLKVMEAMVKSCHQAGLRGGSATVHFPFFHYDIQDIVVLKNNAGTDDNRVRKLDYSIQFSKLFYERFMKGEDITLFSPHEVTDLYKAFGTPDFDTLYKQYEKDETLTFKKKIPSATLMSLVTKERVETGRIYVMNNDHCNEHSPWKETVYMSNLCQEILQPTVPLKHIDDPDAEIGICVLSAINLLEINGWRDLEKTCDIVVRLLDELIDYQEYFIPAAEKFTKNRRSLGIGVSNLAGLLAKNDISYESTDAPNFVDEWMERIQFYLLSSSNKLAQEKGKCAYFDRTKYSDGILPIDTYKKKLDTIVTRPLSMDWESLRSSIVEHGLRNSTVTAQMPVESSSVIQSSTNGIEPPRDYITYKKSKQGTLPCIVPHYTAYKSRYTKAYDMKDNIGIINIVAAMQKYMDMSISANVYYDYNHYPDGKLPHSKVIKELLHAYMMGVKTIYYTNTNDMNKNADTESMEEEEDDGCNGGACKI